VSTRVRGGHLETWSQGLVVDLVGEDAQVERLVDSLVEAREQLEQALTTAAHQHGVIAVFIGGGGNATDRTQHANGDVAVLDQLRDIGKRQRRRRNSLPWLSFSFLHAGLWRDAGDEIPSEQFLDTVDGMIGDAGQHLAQIGLRDRGH